MNHDTLKQSLDRLIRDASEVAPSIGRFDEDRNYGRVTDEALDHPRLIRWQTEVSTVLQALVARDRRMFGQLQARYDETKAASNRHHSRSILVRMTRDILQAAVDLLESPLLQQPLDGGIHIGSEQNEQTTKGYGFIAMPMDADDHALVDVLDAIKTAARACGVEAERVDEPQSNERISDRILESIRRAEFVFVDLTGSRANVFFEAGYAHGLGKLPIYLARQGTRLEFDLKDYPVLFFRNLAELKTLLTKRIQGLQSETTKSQVPGA